MTLITPERAAELLALLPENANFAAIGDSELYLCWPDPESNWPPGVGSRTVAELEPEDEALHVLANVTDALRTVQHLSALLEQIRGLTPAFPHMLTDAALRFRMKQIQALLERHEIDVQERAL